MRSSATMLPVASAIADTTRLAPSGILPLLLPPETITSALFVLIFAGLTTTSQCSHSVRFTSFAVRQDCDLRLITNDVAEVPSIVLATFHWYAGSGCLM